MDESPKTVMNNEWLAQASLEDVVDSLSRNRTLITKFQEEIRLHRAELEAATRCHEIEQRARVELIKALREKLSAVRLGGPTSPTEHVEAIMPQIKKQLVDALQGK